MQKLVKAAKEGTKDGLERTKAAVRRGRSFIRSHSLMPQGLCGWEHLESMGSGGAWAGACMGQCGGARGVGSIWRAQGVGTGVGEHRQE